MWSGGGIVKKIFAIDMSDSRNSIKLMGIESCIYFKTMATAIDLCFLNHIFYA